MTKRKSTTEGRPARHADDAEARREAVALLRGDVALSDELRLDTIMALRASIDNANDRAMRGERIDLAQVLQAEERLRAILPPARPLPDNKLAEHQRRQAALAPVLKFVRSLHEEIATLQAENVTLRQAARTALAPAPAANAAPDIDIVPPYEIADRDPGMRPGPDDPKPPTVIDGDAVDIRAGFDNDTPEPWRRFSHLYE
jgi:hypothetical protein